MQARPLNPKPLGSHFLLLRVRPRFSVQRLQGLRFRVCWVLDKEFNLSYLSYHNRDL